MPIPRQYNWPKVPLAIACIKFLNALPAGSP